VTTASVLIVAYRTPELIDDCLKSLYAGITDEVEVVVVDNASGDGTAEQIAANWPQVKLIVSDTNLGFARAVNLAARHATGEVLVLLNPDTVVHDDPVAELVSFLRERPEVGLAGGRTLAPDGTLDPRSCWGGPPSGAPSASRPGSPPRSRATASWTRRRSAAGSATTSARWAS
jgi:GT2 family glycosyltransferase